MPTSEFRRRQKKGEKKKTLSVFCRSTSYCSKRQPIMIQKTNYVTEPNKVRCLFHLPISRNHLWSVRERSIAKKKYYDFCLHVEPWRILYLSGSLAQWHPYNAFSHHEKPFLVLILDISKFPALCSSRDHCSFTHNCWYLWAIWGFAYCIFLDDSWKQQ